MAAQTERNQEIVARYLAGESIGKLAIDFGVVRQRINQITKAAGVHRPRVDVSIPGSAKQVRKAIANGTRPDWRRPPGGKTLDIIALREARPDNTYQQISDALDVAAGTVANALKRWRPDLLRRGPCG